MSQVALPSEEGEYSPLKMRVSSLPIHKKKGNRNHKKSLVWGRFLIPELQCPTWCRQQACYSWLRDLKALAWDYRSHFQKLQGWPWQSLLRLELSLPANRPLKAQPPGSLCSQWKKRGRTPIFFSFLTTRLSMLGKTDTNHSLEILVSLHREELTAKGSNMMTLPLTPDS